MPNWSQPLKRYELKKEVAGTAEHTFSAGLPSPPTNLLLSPLHLQPRIRYATTRKMSITQNQSKSVKFIKLTGFTSSTLFFGSHGLFVSQFFTICKN